MSMETADPAYVAGRMAELQKENDELREQLRRFAAHSTVTRGALQEAMHEKETTAKLAHQVTAEERATRAAVEVQGNNIGLSVILQVLNFFMLLILVFGLFVWLPNEVERRVDRPNPVVAPDGTVVVPGR